MRHSTMKKPVMKEIICKKGADLGSNHWQMVVPTIQEATEGPCHLKNKNKDGQ